MARERFLALTGCLLLLGLAQACGDVCLNPQPEPPGKGCGEAFASRQARDAGFQTITDASVSTDAARDRSSGGDSDGAPTSSDAGIDREQRDGSDVAADAQGDTSDGAADTMPADVPVDGSPDTTVGTDAGADARGDVSADIGDGQGDTFSTDTLPTDTLSTDADGGTGGDVVLDSATSSDGDDVEVDANDP
jgi:hypothetical protein